MISNKYVLAWEPANPLYDLSENIPKILRSYGKMPAEDKSIITKMLKLMVASYMNIIRENVIFSNRKENIKTIRKI